MDLIMALMTILCLVCLRLPILLTPCVFTAGRATASFDCNLLGVAKEAEAGTDGFSVPCTFLFLEIGRNFRSRGTALNALDKGKSSNTTRHRPLFWDIDFLVDRPESCVDLRS